MIDKVYVDIKSSEIFVKVFDRYENVLEKNFTGKVKEQSMMEKALNTLENVFGKKYLIHEADFEGIREIINKSYDKDEKVKKD